MRFCIRLTVETDGAGSLVAKTGTRREFWVATTFVLDQVTQVLEALAGKSGRFSCGDWRFGRDADRVNEDGQE